MFEEYPIYHEITYGDSLYTLANTYNTTVEDVLNMNPHINPYNLFIGTVLKIIPGHNINTLYDSQKENSMYNTPNNTYIPLDNMHNSSLNNCISKNEFDLIKNMRLAWSQHVYWIRLLIISIVDNLNDTDNTTQRVLQTVKDISDSFAPYYGPEVATNLNKLLAEHIVIGKELIIAAKNKNATDVDRLNKQWYANAEQMAEVFNKINPSHFNKEKLRKMIHTHLDLTKEELSNRLNRNYANDVISFNKIETEAMIMADYFVDGIVKQFPDQFRT